MAQFNQGQWNSQEFGGSGSVPPPPAPPVPPAPPRYTITTFAAFQASLAQRLGDPTNQWWTVQELQFYIREALQVWQAHSQFYSIKAGFQTAPNVLFYDLTSEIPQLTPTITDQELIEQIQIHLQEPISANSWPGTPQFSYDEVVSAIQKRRDQFFLETGLVQAVTEVPAPMPSSGEFPLDDLIIDIRRAMWKDFNGNYSILWRADEFSFLGANPGWYNTAGIPSDFSTVLQQPLSIQLSPPPADQGFVNILSTNSGLNLEPESVPSILGVPDDFVWVVKFGVLADLVGKAGPGNDSYRADYFESRWHDGIELARITNFVKLGFQNGLPAFVDSMEELDTTHPDWVSNAPGIPDGLALAGNLVATNPIPDGTYSLFFSITPNMVLPQTGRDFIQVGQEFLNIILDYAQHLAQIKEGMAEISQTMGLYKNFMAAAMVENDRLRAAAENFDVLSDRTQKETHQKLRRITDLGLKDLDYVPQSK